jgi:hypothetical protein
MIRQTDPHVSHLREYELADYLEGALDPDAEKQVRIHLDGCDLCSGLLAGAGPELLRVSVPAGSVQEPTLPQALRDALARHTVASPAVGQLWKLRAPADHGEIAALAAIARLGDDHVLVVPVTPDTQEATDLWTVQLPLADSGLDMAFWTSVSTPVGYEVLDVLLGWTDATPLTDLLRAQRRGEAPPRGLRLGRQLDIELAAYRADLHNEFAQLQDALLIPDSPERADADIDVVDALKEADWSPSRLKAVAGGGLRAGEAAAVLERRHRLTPEQLECVGGELGQTVSAGATEIEWGWVTAVASPMRRHRFEMVASSQHEDPWTFRGNEAAQPHLMAARKSDGTWQDWDQLVEDRLRALEIAAGLV